MLINRIVEYSFFFGLLLLVGYLVWEIISPFVSALALAAIIVTICYPLYERIKSKVPKRNASLAAMVSTLLVLVVVIMPVLLISSTLVNEALSVYRIANTEQIEISESLRQFEAMASSLIPGLEVSVTEYLKQAAGWLAGNLGAIFAGTASTIFLFFIALIGSFYFFRDGREFTKQLVKISPLPDDEDVLILNRLASSVRSIATGTVLVALIQGVLTAFGLWLFGFERAVLWGTIAAFGALIPGVGTTIVFLPAVAFLVYSGMYIKAMGVFLWAAIAVGLIDNLLGPYLMSRGNKLHPFLILLSVLGGVSLFGPIGFIVGPVVLSFFVVLLELYSVHISDYNNSENES